MKRLLLVLLLTGQIAFATTTFEIAAEGINPVQLGKIKQGQIQCKNSATEVEARFRITNFFITPDGKPEFAAEIKITSNFSDFERIEVPAKTQILRWILNGNVDAANRSYRGDLNLEKARRAFFQNQTQWFLLNADGFEIAVNARGEKTFKVLSSQPNSITLEATEISVKAMDVQEQASCLLRLEFVEESPASFLH